MRLTCSLIAAAAALATQAAMAHGPQIQTTLDAGKIVTREIVDDTAYSTTETAPKLIYAMPLDEYLGVWRAQPDDSATGGIPDFIGWPGFAYGFGYDATNNPAPFPVGSRFILGFTAGLKKWSGAAFVDAGVTEAEAYRGPSASPSALAKTSDSGPFASLMFPGVSGISFASEGADTHNSVHYRLAGDGSSITSDLPDGIYLLSLQLSSNNADVTASDPFYFVLTKNGGGAVPTAINSLVNSLGLDPSQVQVIVPEPAAAGLAALGLAGLLPFVRRRKLARSRLA